MTKIIDHIEELAYAEKLDLLEALKAAIAEEIAGRSAKEPVVCPWCGSSHYVKKGLDQDGSRRWLCRGCARTFSKKSAGLLTRSKLDSSVWMTFAECMADVLPLRETALRCGVSLKSAWFMRIRVCEILSYRLPPLRQGNFHVDDTYLVENLSGNHKRSTWYKMPREPHRNGQDGKRGQSAKSKSKAAIVCGINEFGDCFCDLLAQGVPYKFEMSMLLEDRLPKGSFFITDGHLSYPDDLWGITHEIVDPSNHLTGDINMVNALHSRLKEFISSFHGVATRRLQSYLDWFCYREQFKSSDTDRRELLFKHETEGHYIYTRFLTHLAARPFLSYWDRRRYADITRRMSMMG